MFRHAVEVAESGDLAEDMGGGHFLGIDLRAEVAYVERRERRLFGKVAAEHGIDHVRAAGEEAAGEEAAVPSQRTKEQEILPARAARASPCRDRR